MTLSPRDYAEPGWPVSELIDETARRMPRVRLHVLGIIEGPRAQLDDVVDAAAALADRTRARLTLARSSDDESVVTFCGTFLVGQLPIEADWLAQRVLSLSAQRVPSSTPVTTMLLSDRLERDLSRLISTSGYGAVVADGRTWRRLRVLLRTCETHGVLPVRI